MITHITPSKKTINSSAMYDYKIAQVEFGMDLVRQVWVPFIYKQCFPNCKLKVTSPHYFPDEITKQFCDEFVIESGVKERDTPLHYHSLLRTIRKTVPKNLFDRRLKLPEIERQVDEPYVCFIPLLSDWFNGNMVYNFFGGATVYFKHWMNYKKILNEKGYKVFVLGNTEEIGYENLPKGAIKEDLGDYHFYREGKNKNEYYLWEQLKIMQHAKFTIGMGGGGLVAPTFGLPCISVDKLFHKHFTRKFPFEQFTDMDILWNFNRKDLKRKRNEKMVAETDKFVLECLEKRLK